MALLKSRLPFQEQAAHSQVQAAQSQVQQVAHYLFPASPHHIRQLVHRNCDGHLLVSIYMRVINAPSVRTVLAASYAPAVHLAVKLHLRTVVVAFTRRLYTQKRYYAAFYAHTLNANACVFYVLCMIHLPLYLY